VRLREGSGQSKKNNALFVAQQLQGLDQRFIQLFSIDTSSDRHERKGGESDYRMVNHSKAKIISKVLSSGG
jgi:hypothetical protein